MGCADHPTILVVHQDREFRDLVIRTLQAKGYLILEASNAVEALGVAVRHSRRIHLLLADDSDHDRAMAVMLKPYRPDMHAIHIRSDLRLEAVLMEVSEVLEAPTHVFEDRKSARNQVEAAFAARVVEARRHYLQSSPSFREAADDVSSGIPHPDGVARLQRPAYERRRAFGEYLKDRKRLEDLRHE
jgi:CheY-like chemotaxis protein